MAAWLFSALGAGVPLYQAANQHVAPLHLSSTSHYSFQSEALYQSAKLQSESIEQAFSHHEEQMSHDTELARRESLRDLWGQKNHRTQTLMIVDTLMFSCGFAMFRCSLLCVFHLPQYCRRHATHNHKPSSHRSFFCFCESFFLCSFSFRLVCHAASESNDQMYVLYVSAMFSRIQMQFPIKHKSILAVGHTELLRAVLFFFIFFDHFHLKTTIATAALWGNLPSRCSTLAQHFLSLQQQFLCIQDLH
jgi:hypothetical protein